MFSREEIEASILIKYYEYYVTETKNRRVIRYRIYGCMFVCLYRFCCSLYIKGKQCFWRGFLNFHHLVIYRELEVITAKGSKQTTGFEQNALQNVIKEIMRRFQVCLGSESFPLRLLYPTLHPVAPLNMQIYVRRANFSTKNYWNYIFGKFLYVR